MIRLLRGNLVLAVSFVSAALGAMLAVVPVERVKIVSFGADETSDARAPVMVAPKDIARLASLFDRTALPPSYVAPPPPPDPAAGLKRFHFLGVARVDGGARALFSAGGAVVSLAPGDDLEGFSLVEASGAGALFVADEAKVRLPLEAQQ